MALGTAASLAIGAGLGGVKYAMDKSSADAERKRNAQANVYSPWSGNKFAMPANPKLGDSLFQGAAMGAMMGGDPSGTGSLSGTPGTGANGGLGLGGADMVKELGAIGQDVSVAGNPLGLTGSAKSLWDANNLANAGTKFAAAPKVTPWSF